ncbi:MAG TPA: chromosomal replication initiator protein DnaA [Ktedonobacterales bacterium]|nr:chromosomal replication initiator protein DnaA [Ktedonobacterales bacterium]
MSSANAHVWRAAQERLRRQLKRAEYDTWLRDTQLVAPGDGSTVLRVRTTFACELVKSRYRDLIEAALAEVTGQRCTLQVAVMTGSEAAEEEPAETHVPARAASVAATRSSPRRAVSAYTGPTLFGMDDASGAAAIESEASSPRAPQVSQPLTHTRGPGRILPSDTAAKGLRGGRARAAFERNRGLQRSSSTGMEPDGRQPGPTERTQGPPRRDHLNEAGNRNGATHDASVHRATAVPRSGRGTLDGMATMERDGEADAAGMSWRDTPEPLDPGRGRYFGAPDPRVAEAAAASSAGMAIPPPRLNPRYTFSTFIVGSGNQLAHAASVAVAEAPGQAYNPLFLYGGVGLGKTHLLHAIGHTAVERNQTVLYVSSETFTNEIINAIRYRNTEEFRAKYRSADVLLVDDIQFIAGKESTEEEFFHTFNSLYETNRQIVICSDRPPKAIVALAERLRSRFEWGLIADIQPPDLETRVAILRAKADVLGRHVPDDVILFLASRVHSNIRELEGGFNRLLAFSQLQGLPLTIDMAKAALASLAEDGRQRRVGVDDVLQAVAEHYRVSIEDLRGKQRDKHIVVPRQIAMYLMRQETEASLLEIGQALGGRDHSTVMHGCDKINREVNENASLRKEVLSIRQQLIG